MYSPREAVERTIRSGTFGGLALGLIVGAFACALAVGALILAFEDGLLAGDPLNDVFLLAVAPLAIAAAVSSAYSGIAAHRRRRAGWQPHSDDHMASEELIERAIARRAWWAIALVIVVGLALGAVGLALAVGLVSGDTDFSVGDLIGAVCLPVFGAVLIAWAVRDPGLTRSAGRASRGSRMRRRARRRGRSGER